MREDWKEVRFGELTELIKRGIAPKYVEEGGYIVINQKCIRNGVLSFGDSRLSSKEKKVAKEKFVQIGDVLINSTGTGTLGRTAPVRKLPGATTVDTHVTILRGNDKVDKLFLGYLASHYEPLITLLGKGATNQIELGASDLKVTKVAIPESKETQRKIASILSAYDDLIENNLKRIKLLEEKAQLTYEEWFLRMKFPGHETTPINMETGLPEGWEKRPFEDVIDFKEGPGLRNWQYREEGIPFLNIRVIKDGDIDMTKIQFLDPEEVENKYKHFLLEENDHVISSSGTLGRLTTIRKCHLPICLNTSIIRMRSKDEQFGKWLIKHTLLGQIFQSTMEIYANGSAQVNFGPTHLKQIKLPIPSTEIAVRYERIMEPIEEHIKLLRDKNRHLKEARDILLPRLMTGMINVEQMNFETIKPTTA